MEMPAWTYSQLDSFESCPKKFYHVRVKKDVVEPPTIYTDWGTLVHTAMEDRVKDATPLPQGMEQWEKIAASIAALPGEILTEQKYAIDKDFQPTDWQTAWTRGIADVVVVNGTAGAVMDYKTGKRKPTEQLELYAAYMFAHYPKMETVKTSFIWLKERKLDSTTVKRDELPAVWKGFLSRQKRLQIAYDRDVWPPKPSGLCKGWCPCTGCEFYTKGSKR